jgi:hypothetical protein
VWILCLAIKGTDPFKLSVKLLLFSLICSFFIYKITSSLWFSAVVILCFSRGIMILITYITSISSREKTVFHRSLLRLRWSPLLILIIPTLEKTFTRASSKWTMKTFSFNFHTLFMIILLLSFIIFSICASFSPMKPLKSFI